MSLYFHSSQRAVAHSIPCSWVTNPNFYLSTVLQQTNGDLNRTMSHSQPQAVRHPRWCWLTLVLRVFQVMISLEFLYHTNLKAARGHLNLFFSKMKVLWDAAHRERRNADKQKRPEAFSHHGSGRHVAGRERMRGTAIDQGYHFMTLKRSFK